MSAENIIRIKEKMDCAVSFDFNKICFPSESTDSFRVKGSTSPDGVILWAESVKTKQQWRNTVEKTSDCGPSGIPDGVVYTLLEVNFVLYCFEHPKLLC